MNDWTDNVVLIVMPYAKWYTLQIVEKYYGDLDVKSTLYILSEKALRWNLKNKFGICDEIVKECVKATSSGRHYTMHPNQEAA